jgi:hypothetical protein
MCLKTKNNAISFGLIDALSSEKQKDFSPTHHLATAEPSSHTLTVDHQFNVTSFSMSKYGGNLN